MRHFARIGLGATFLAALAIPFAATPALAVASTSNEWAVPAANVQHLVDAGLAVTGTENGVELLSVDGEAVAELASTLDVTDHSVVGYDRDLFKHWTDADGNGLDTRNEILARDLTNVTLTDNGRYVATGTLLDPYTGMTIEFARYNDDGSSTRGGGIDIDHIIPLSAAWTGGANEWDADTREAFANDPRNLLAVDASANRQKGDQLPGEWMPANTDYACAYVAQVVWVADEYELAVTQLDLDAILDTSATCTLAVWAIPGGDPDEATHTAEVTEPAAVATPTTDEEIAAAAAEEAGAVDTLAETGGGAAVPFIIGCVLIVFASMWGAVHRARQVGSRWPFKR